MCKNIKKEITSPIEYMINFNKQGFCSTGIGLRHRFNWDCELFKFILEENKEKNQKLIADIPIIQSLFTRVLYDSTDEIFVWINENEYKAICSFITLDKEERSEKISKSTFRAIEELQDRYETIERSNSYEFFIERFCIIVVLKEIEVYISEKIKEKEREQIKNE